MSKHTHSPTPSDRELMRLVHGELDAERRLELRRALARDPALAERLHRLETTWKHLELAPPAAVPLGFATRVVARARAERPGSELSWALAPVWARAGAALALAGGIWLGASLSRLEPVAPQTTGAATTVAASAETGVYEVYGEGLSLAESYWQTLEEVAPAQDSNGDGPR